MSEILHEASGDLSILQQRHVALLGSQGIAQALTLRDAGVDVRLGLPTDSDVRTTAESEGLRVLTAYEACEEADLVVMAMPHSLQAATFTEAVSPNLVDGDALLFNSAFAIRFGVIAAPAGVDVALVTPKASDQLLRREAMAGRGVPAYVAVAQDASGRAWEIALSYAKALGSLRVGAIKTTFAEQAETALFGNEVLVNGAISTLLVQGVESLIEAGYQPEVAYFECVQTLKSVVDGIYEAGISPSAFEGKIVDGTKERLAAAIQEIRSGELAQKVIASGSEAQSKDPLDAAGRAVRKLMPWVKSRSNEE